MQLQHLQARRPLPLALLHLLPGALWCPDSEGQPRTQRADELVRERLLVAHMPTTWGSLHTVRATTQSLLVLSKLLVRNVRVLGIVANPLLSIRMCASAEGHSLG